MTAAESSPTRAGGSAVRITRRFDAPREEVFRAWTDPDWFRQWFKGQMLITGEVEMDARVGGRFRIPLKPTHGVGWTAYAVGEYLEIEPPARLVFTFGWERQPLGTGTGESRVTVILDEVLGATEMRFLHELPDKIRLRAFHRWGWTYCFDRLGGLLELPPAR